MVFNWLCNTAGVHNKTLITKTSALNERDFIVRNIYKDIYWTYTGIGIMFSFVHY